MGCVQPKGAAKSSHHGTVHDASAVYVGGLLQGQRHGLGELTFSDGRVYQGQFEEDQITGHGSYTCLNGIKYIGEFLNGEMSGEGRLIGADGHVS